MSDKSFGTSGFGIATVEEDDTVTSLGFFFGAVPLTGWWGDYVYVTRDRKPRLLWVRFL